MGIRVLLALLAGCGLFLWGMFRIDLTLGIVVSGISLMLIAVSQIEVKKGDST